MAMTPQHKQSMMMRRNAISSMDLIESEDELNYLPVLEAATENNHHIVGSEDVEIGFTKVDKH